MEETIPSRLTIDRLAVKPCCLESIKRYIKKARDVATCDVCGWLLLSYGSERDFEETMRALMSQQMPFEFGNVKQLRVIAKPRFRKK